LLSTGNLGFYSYAAAAVGFVLLAAWILIGNRGRPAKLIASACLVSAAWAVCASLASSNLVLNAILLAVFEPLHTAAWIVTLIYLPVAAEPSRTNEHSITPGDLANFRRLALVIGSALLTISIASDFLLLGERLSFASKIAMSVFGLVAVEQLFRNTPFEARWSIKMLCIALFALFSFDIVMYSDALLFGKLKFPWWITRGFAALSIIPLIALTMGRSKTWGVGLAVSRSVAFHSAALLVSGTYLLILSLGAYWVSTVGGGWGEVLQTTVAFLALLSLVIILLSSQVRAWLRVTVYKNFFRLRYDYREEWLKFTRGMAPGDNDHSTAERSLKSLADLVQANRAALYLRSEDNTYVLAVRKGTLAQGEIDPPMQLQHSDSLVQFLTNQDWVISASEYALRPQAYAGLSLPTWCSATTDQIIIAPLRLDKGLLGIAILRDLRVPLEVDWEVRDILKAMGRQAASYLAQEEAVKALLVARQFESFNRMSAFVVHDLKNLVAQLSLMLANADKHKHNPEFQEDMLGTVQNVVDRMRGLLLQLRAGTKPIEAPTLVNLAEAVRGALRSKPGLKVVPRVTFEEPDTLFVRAHQDRLERVIGHLVQNASEAISADGRIEVFTRRTGDEAQLEVSDNGKGMTQEFISLQLFKPFESTKALGMGIGAFESREYIRELGGRLEVHSTEGSGTQFTIHLEQDQSQYGSNGGHADNGTNGER
jgi:putative PEP-CTERM system histidine kinase